MTKRQVLATATLVALPMFVGVSPTVPEPAAARLDAVHSWQMTGQHAGPQWAWAWGMEGEEALAFGLAGAIECSFFGPVGALACGVTGAL